MVSRHSILSEKGIFHHVLNARPERAQIEAETIAQAGRPGTITVSTNMAGRGTDIILGGNAELLTRSRLKFELFHCLFESLIMRTEDFEVLGSDEEKEDFFKKSEAFLNTQRMPFMAMGQVLPSLSEASKALTTRAEDVIERISTDVEFARFNVSRLYETLPDKPLIVDSLSDESIKYYAIFNDMRTNAIRLLDSACDYAEFILRNEGSAAILKQPELYFRSDPTTMGDSYVLESIKSAALMILLEYTHECLCQQQEAINNGGLAVIATQLHDSRRIDNQLKGRAGRQGDPGMSMVFTSLDDMLFKITSRGTMKVLDMIGYVEYPIESPLMRSSLSNLQADLEGSYRKNRKQTYEFDEVLDVHRRQLYRLRRRILQGDRSTIRNHAQRFMQLVIDDILLQCVDCDKTPDNWNLQGIVDMFNLTFIGLDLSHVLIRGKSKELIQDLAEDRWPDQRLQFHAFGIEAAAQSEARRIARLEEPLFKTGKHQISAELFRAFLHEYVILLYETRSDSVKKIVQSGEYADQKAFETYEKKVMLQALDDFWRVCYNKKKFANS